MASLNRRQFLRQCALSTAALSLLASTRAEEKGNQTNVLSTARRSANEDIRYAVVGFNQRGQSHLSDMRKVKGTRLVALCDVDRTVLAREIKNAEAKDEKVKGYTDIRLLLENKDIDVITIATPNHWHSLAAIWAIQAGKDVYVEKPVSHNVWEGRQLVNAAQKYQKIVQSGTQCRSNSGIRDGMAWLHAGKMGKIIRARGLCYKRRPSIGKVEGPQVVPESIDYDIWCGPAPKEPLMRKKLHYDWHYIWNEGNGDLGNQGIHQMDLARWALGQNSLSPRVLSVGGRLGYIDDGQTPNSLIIYHDYPDAPLIFEVHGLPVKAGSDKMDELRGVSVGLIVDCEGGSMVIRNYNTSTFFDQSGKEVKKFHGESNHFENFIHAVRSRDASHLNANVLEGHLSSALCHMGNISYRLGKTAALDEIAHSIEKTTDLKEAFGRMQKHLLANDVDLQKTPALLGGALSMDPKSERFPGNQAANELLTRNYRAPFVVPQI